MKKIIKISAALLVPLLLCGCGGKEADTTVNENTTITENITTSQETEPETTQAPETLPPEVQNAENSTAFTVTKAYGNGMVVQRNEYIRVWGWADEAQNGKRVNAEFGGLYGAALIEGGAWLITLLGTLPENTEGQTFRVYGDGVEYTYSDVLVGDVYWVAGQSNIHYSVQSIINEPLATEAGRNIEITNSDLIRLNRNATTDPSGLSWGTTDMNRDVVQPRGWEYPEQGAKAFSAVGYFFAKQLYAATEGKIPLGLIEFDADGCALNAFCPNEVCDELKIDKLVNGVYTAQSVNNHPTRFVYNHYMYAWQNYPICGVVWYQGESDLHTANATKFAKRYTALITEYRDRHDLINHDYPIYFVEFPSIYVEFDFSLVRAYTGTIANMLSNFYMAAASDLWKDKTYGNNLHPYIKWENAQRVSALAEAAAYGIGELENVAGPQMVSVTYSEDRLTATVKYKYVGGGLKCEGDGLLGFQLNVTGGWKAPESAEIVGTDTVVLTYTTKIKGVRYNCVRDYSFPETCNLCSGTGVPAVAFID